MFEDYTRCLNDAIEMKCAIVHKIQIAWEYTKQKSETKIAPHNDELYIMPGSDTLPLPM